MKLETLYKKSKTGAIQVYNISVCNNIITVEFGQLNGKMQSKTTTCTSKNIGKSNETSPDEQAIVEAKAKHADSIKSGYTLDISGEVIIRLPQKVKSYLDNKHLVKFPSFITPKLNGINGTYCLVNDELVLTSRGGETYPKIKHLEEEIIKIMKLLDTDCLNGELYIHGEHLQDIQSAVKKPNSLSNKLKFFIFELPNVNKKYSEKYDTFKFLNSITNLSNVTSVDPEIVESHEEIESIHNKYVSSGLEGSVIYNHDSVYEFNVRSSSVLKYKYVQDLEVEIMSYNVDKNGHPVFNVSYNGKEFKVKPTGTDLDRKEIIRNFEEEYKNKWYKIEYEMFSKSGIPLKPIGICLRYCDKNGNPLV